MNISQGVSPGGIMMNVLRGIIQLICLSQVYMTSLLKEQRCMMSKLMGVIGSSVIFAHGLLIVKDLLIKNPWHDHRFSQNVLMDKGP